VWEETFFLSQPNCGTTNQLRKKRRDHEWVRLMDGLAVIIGLCLNYLIRNNLIIRKWQWWCRVAIYSKADHGFSIFFIFIFIFKWTWLLFWRCEQGFHFTMSQTICKRFFFSSSSPLYIYYYYYMTLQIMITTYVYIYISLIIFVRTHNLSSCLEFRRWTHQSRGLVLVQWSHRMKFNNLRKTLET